MPGSDLRAVEQLRRLAAAQEADADLLERFRATGDSDSFAELVRRHGPVVLGVCRRVLGNAADADDAFQAVFLVLARKGAARRESLAGWLFGVARFTAMRARDKARRRREHEAKAIRPRPEPPTDAELLAVVDEELHRLPDDLRSPLVACVLQGQTQEDAARASGCSLSTLRRRLERGQEALRKRLTARGLAPALAVAALGTVSASLTATQIQAATALVVAFTTGTAAATPATELAQGVIATMARTKLKAVAAVALAAVLIGGTAWGFAAAQPPMVPPGEPKNPAKEPPPKTADLPPAKAEPKKADPDAKADRIKPGDRIVIRGNNLFPQSPLEDFYEVEPSGKVALGPIYGGRVKIDGLTLEEAEVVMRKHLREIAVRAEVSITRYIPPPVLSLDARVEKLEKEVKELRTLVEELRARKP